MRERTKLTGKTPNWLRLNYHPGGSSSPSCLAMYDYQDLGDRYTGGSYMLDLPSYHRLDKPVIHIAWEAPTVGWTHNIDMQYAGAHCMSRRHFQQWNITPETVIDIAKSIHIPYPNPSIADVWDRLSNPFGNNFTETLAELGSVKSLFSSVRAKLNFFSNVPKGIRGLPRGVSKKLLRRRSDVRRLLGSVTQETLATYLEWEFGWKQCAEDLARLIAFVREIDSHSRKMVDNQGETLRIGFKRSDSVESEIGSGLRFKASGTSRVTYKCRYHYTKQGTLAKVVAGSSVHTEILQRLSATASFWGLESSAGNAWDLFPASWLIDQFLPIGDLLDDLGTGNPMFGVGQTIDFMGHVKSQKLNFEITQTQPPVSFYAHGAHFNWSSSEAVATGTVYRRDWSPGAPPSFSFRPRRGGVSNTGKAYIGLLAAGKVKG